MHNCLDQRDRLAGGRYRPVSAIDPVADPACEGDQSYQKRQGSIAVGRDLETTFLVWPNVQQGIQHIFIRSNI